MKSVLVWVVDPTLSPIYSFIQNHIQIKGVSEAKRAYSIRPLEKRSPRK